MSTPTTQTKAATEDVRLSKIAMVILYSRDPAKALPFYRDVLGMTVQEASPGWIQLEGGGVSLALHSTDKEIPHHDREPWVVFGVDDVRAAYAALEAKGVKFLGPLTKVCGDDANVGLSGDFRDPDGNQLSIFGMTTA